MNDISKPALLEHLAEEASELSHAALKYARVLRKENPTPVTEEQAIVKLVEEYTDVIHSALALNLLFDGCQIVDKQERWDNRIKEIQDDIKNKR